MAGGGAELQHQARPRPRYDGSNGRVQGNHVYRAPLPAPPPPPPPQYQQQHAKPPLALSAVPIPGINKEAAQVGTACTSTG